MAIFDFTASVRVVRRPTGFVGDNPQFFESIGNAIEFGHAGGIGPRIRFTVTKNLGKEPNKATIQISNLAEHTRAELEKDVLGVTLYAGYDGQARLLHTGDLKRASSKRDGTDIVTTLEVADGLRAFQHARMNRSYKPPIHVSRVLSDAARSMGLDLPPELEQSAELKQALASGISMHGPTREVLTRLLAPYGYHWSIQNGRLLVLKDGTTRPGEAILVNEDSGLIGAPDRTTPTKRGGKSEVRFETVLWPELGPGALVRLESEFLRLNLKVTDVTHIGDTGGTDRRTTVTGRPL